MRRFTLLLLALVLAGCSTTNQSTPCDGGECVEPAPCEPNPCRAAFRGVCQVVDGKASCVCVTGYFLKAEECVPTPPPGCEFAHSGGPGEDSYEPDECPGSARPLIAGDSVQAHTIAPSGDQDNYLLVLANKQVVSLDITGATLPLNVDVYDEQGTLITSDRRGVLNPSLMLIGGPVLSHVIRVYASGGGGTGDYQIAAHPISQGQLDDRHANHAADASVVVVDPPWAFYATLDYSGDEDWVQFDAQRGHVYEVEFDWTNSAYTRVDVVHQDGGLRTTLRPVSPGPYVDRIHSQADERFAVRGYTTGASLPSFSVLISGLGADDHGDDRASATPLPGPGTYTALYQRPSDYDFFTVPVTAGRVYAAECPSNQCTVTIYSASGAYLSSSSWGRADAKATATELWGLSVRGNTPSYTFTFSDLGLDDHGDSRAAGSPLTVGTPLSAQFEFSADHDWFEFAGTAGTIYRASCATCAYDILGADGGRVTGSTYGATADWMASANESFAVHAWRYGSAGYTLAVTSVGTDDHGDTRANATTLTGASGTGTLNHTNDIDAFALQAAAGSIQRITASTTAWVVQSSAGATIASYVAHSALPAFRVPADGVFYVLIGKGTASSQYSFSISPGGSDDHGDSASAATPLQLDAGVSATSQFQGDLDVFSLDALAGHIYRVDCANCSSVIAGPGGASVPVLDDSWRKWFRAGTSGQYTVTLSSPSSYTPLTSNLLVTDHGVDDHGDSIGNATALTIGTTRSSALNFSGDVDAFSYGVTAGRIYSIDISCNGSSVQYRPYDAQGVPGNWSYIYDSKRFAAAQTQTLYFTLSVGYSSASCSVAVVDRGVDDHSGDQASGTPHTVGGTSSGVIQYAGDIDVFTFPVTLGKHYHLKLESCSGCMVRVTNEFGVFQNYNAYANELGFRSNSNATWAAFVERQSTWYSDVPYTLTSAEYVDDYPDDYSSAPPLAIGATQSGVLESPLDSDAFLVYLNPNTLYTVTVTASATLWISAISQYGSGVSGNSNTPNVFSFYTTNQPGLQPHAIRVTAQGTGVGGSYQLKIQ